MLSLEFSSFESIETYQKYFRSLHLLKNLGI